MPAALQMAVPAPPAGGTQPRAAQAAVAKTPEGKRFTILKITHAPPCRAWAAGEACEASVLVRAGSGAVFEWKGPVSGAEELPTSLPYEVRELLRGMGPGERADAVIPAAPTWNSARIAVSASVSERGAPAPGSSDGAPLQALLRECARRCQRLKQVSAEALPDACERLRSLRNQLLRSVRGTRETFREQFETAISGDRLTMLAQGIAEETVAADEEAATEQVGALSVLSSELQSRDNPDDPIPHRPETEKSTTQRSTVTELPPRLRLTAWDRAAYGLESRIQSLPLEEVVACGVKAHEVSRNTEYDFATALGIFKHSHLASALLARMVQIGEADTVSSLHTHCEVLHAFAVVSVNLSRCYSRLEKPRAAVSAARLGIETAPYLPALFVRAEIAARELGAVAQARDVSRRELLILQGIRVALWLDSDSQKAAVLESLLRALRQDLRRRVGDVVEEERWSRRRILRCLAPCAPCDGMEMPFTPVHL